MKLYFFIEEQKEFLTVRQVFQKLKCKKKKKKKNITEKRKIKTNRIKIIV